MPGGADRIFIADRAIFRKFAHWGRLTLDPDRHKVGFTLGVKLCPGDVGVEIVFRARALERCYREHKAAVRSFGTETARRYIERVNLIKSAHSLSEPLSLPGLRGHPLRGDLAGRYSIRLTGFMRLIVSVENERPAEICIEEMSKHYDD